MQSRAFTKLFASITDSSIWSEDDATRIVWITMLAMSDSHGYVGASVPGLAARARKSVEEVERALERFRAPDTYSRTREYDGRRIVDADGGWVLLNFEKHRGIVSAESTRESKRVWAAKARLAAKVTPEVGDVESESRIEISTVDESRKSRKSPSASSSYSGSDLDPEGVQGEPGSTSRGVIDPPGVFDAPTIALDPHRGRFAPDDFTPTDTHRVRCGELGFVIDDLVREFKLFEFNRDYSDWPKRFSRWIEDAKVKAETQRAKALSDAAKGPSGSFGGGHGQRGTPPLEASESHRRYAQKHGVDLAAIMSHLHRTRAAETLGWGRANEIIGEMLTKRAHEKHVAKKAKASAAP